MVLRQCTILELTVQVVKSLRGVDCKQLNQDGRGDHRGVICPQQIFRDVDDVGIMVAWFLVNSAEGKELLIVFGLEAMLSAEAKDVMTNGEDLRGTILD